MKKIKKWAIALTIFAILLFFPLFFVQAFVFRAGQHVAIGKDEVINEDVFIAGDRVIIEGIINGDLFAAGNQIIVLGKVTGSVITAGGTIDIKGYVGNDVIVAGGMVYVGNEVGDNVIVGGGVVDIRPQAKIKNGLLCGSGELIFAGEAGKVNAGVDKATISGKVKGNVNLQATTKIELATGAIIEGNFNYKAPEEIEIPAEAQILGEIKWEEIKRRVGPDLFGILLNLGLVALGLVIVLLCPKPSQRIVQTITQTPGKSFGWGILVAIVTPIVCVIACLTVIGLPLGIIGLICWGIGLYISQAFLGLFLGDKILKGLTKGKENLVGAMVLGTVIVILISYIPYAGNWIVAIGTLFALGALVSVKKEHWQMISGRESKKS